MKSNVLYIAFPNLSASDHRVTSPATGAYNCIAWAAGEYTAASNADKRGNKGKYERCVRRIGLYVLC